MSLLFLDFDGVLNSADFAKAQFEKGEGGGRIELDPAPIKLLDGLVDDTWCHIVVSSSWRIGRNLFELRDVLKKAGLRNHAAVKSMTDTKGPKRGDEVQRWRDERPQLINEPYCILDDDNDFHQGQKLVQTTWQHGLEMKHVMRAKNFLSWRP